MPDILNVKQRIKNQQAIEEKEDQQLLSDIRETFKSPASLRVLERILSSCDIYSDTFTGNSHTYFFEGKRSIGLEILEMVMKADREIYIKILRGLDNE